MFDHVYKVILVSDEICFLKNNNIKIDLSTNIDLTKKFARALLHLSETETFHHYELCRHNTRD